MLKKVSIILIVVGMIVSWNAVTRAAHIGYWSFDNQCDPGHDDSGSGYDGTVYGATWIAGGQVNGALSFDGDNYVEVTDSPIATTYVEFSAWVRLDTVGYRDGGYILMKGDYLVPETYSIVVIDTDHFPQVRVHVNGGYYIAESTVGLVPDAWTHIQGVYNGTGPGAGLTLNVHDLNNNNIGYDYVAVSGDLYQNSESLYMGTGNHPWLTWEGSIDEVRVYVPEPFTLGLLALGGLVLLRRRIR